MRLNFGMQPGQFDDLPGAGNGIDRGPQDVALHVLVKLAAALLQFHQLGLGLKRVEQDHAAVVGQAQPGRNVRRPGFIGLPLSFQLLVERYDFRAGLPAARSSSYLLVAAQSTIALGTSSHSFRSALR